MNVETNQSPRFDSACFLVIYVSKVCVVSKVRSHVHNYKMCTQQASYQ